jgi:hypothetical protein
MKVFIKVPKGKILNMQIGWLIKMKSKSFYKRYFKVDMPDAMEYK